MLDRSQRDPSLALEREGAVPEPGGRLSVGLVGRRESLRECSEPGGLGTRMTAGGMARSRMTAGGMARSHRVLWAT